MNGVGPLPHPNGGRLDLDLPANAATKGPEVIGLAGEGKAATFENIPIREKKIVERDWIRQLFQVTVPIVSRVLAPGRLRCCCRSRRRAGRWN
jgi:hypothetical protein